MPQLQATTAQDMTSVLPSRIGNNSGPLVTVIIPTHNRADLLPRAVQSVLEQSYRHLELIIVDDASADETPDVTRRLAAEDQRIRVIRNATIADAPQARNIALEIARGEFVAFLDDDDEWLPNKLELQVPLADQYSVVGCLYNKNQRPSTMPVVDPDNVPVRTKSLEAFHFDNRGFCPGSMLSRTEYVRSVGGFDKDLAGPEGMDLFMKLVDRYGESAYIPLPLHIYYTHESHGKPRITTGDKLLRGAIREFEKNKHLRSPAAQRFRLCDIELIKLLQEPTWIERIRCLQRSFTYCDLLRPRLYFKLYMGRLAVNWPVFRQILAIYRQFKYR